MYKQMMHGDTAPLTVIAPALLQALQAWESLYDRLPVAIYTCDADGIIVQYNRRAVELWGRAPELGDREQRFCGAHKLFLMNGQPLAFTDTPMADVLRSGRPARDQEVVIERPNGSRVPVLVNIDPVFDDEGSLVGAVNCFQDISRLKQAEQALRERERWYRELLEALPAAIYTTDGQGRITFYNKAAVELSGREPQLGSDEWCVSWRLYWPDGRPLPHDECPMALALKEERPIRGAEAVAERPDGSRVPFIPYPTPLRDATGKLVGAVNMLVDISERKQAEVRQRRLVDELNHRVKNTLAIVQSLAAQTIRGAGPDDVRKAFEARLMALSRAHDHLTHKAWEAAELKSLMQDIVAPYQNGAENRVVLLGPPVRIDPQAALTVSMVIHELATNAAKYGSLSTPGGQIGLSWAQSAANGCRRLTIDWQEAGGPIVAPPQHRGFGTRLLERAITSTLKGKAEIVFAPGGVRCLMEIPLPADSR